MLLPKPPLWTPSPSLCKPDLQISAARGGARSVHKVILARLSPILEHLLLLCQDEEDVVLMIPDVSPGTLDLALTIAYTGTVGGITQAGVREVRELCNLLSINQEDFLVRAESELVRLGQEELVKITREEAGGLNQEGLSHEYGREFSEKDGGGLSEGNNENLSYEKVIEGKTSQGCFQCRLCQKTFIYIKSFERHTKECQQRIGGGEESSVETPVERNTRKKIQKRSKELEDKNPKTDLFQFVHYQQRDSLVFCSFPGCTYHVTNPGFKTLGGCKNHQLLQHATDLEKIFKCKFCEKSFASNQLRNKHENLTHVKRFPCESCNKVFSEKTRLLVHSRIHSGEKPYVCEDCGFSCSQKDNLRLHKQFKHPKLGKQEKRFVCLICSASFLTKSNLSRHSISHTDLKQCVCETCGKAFKDPGALRQHTFSHGEAQFPCDQCDQRFTSPLYLSRHTVRNHPADGVHPLVCGLCGRGFPLNHQLQEHIDAVHHQVKHCCPHCDQPIGRRSSVHRHIKKGRCRVQSLGLVQQYTDIQQYTGLVQEEHLEVQLGGLVLPGLPPLSSIT